jgi:hypothetical protein
LLRLVGGLPAADAPDADDRLAVELHARPRVEVGVAQVVVDGVAPEDRYPGHRGVYLHQGQV